MKEMMNDPLMRLLAIYLLIINVMAFVLFGIDKYKAVKKKWRIPEASLLMSAVCGGAFGAYIGMKLFHHKTRHHRFTAVIVPSMMIWLILILFMVYRNGSLF